MCSENSPVIYHLLVILFSMFSKGFLIVFILILVIKGFKMF